MTNKDELNVIFFICSQKYFNLNANCIFLESKISFLCFKDQILLKNIYFGIKTIFFWKDSNLESTSYRWWFQSPTSCCLKLPNFKSDLYRFSRCLCCSCCKKTRKISLWFDFIFNYEMSCFECEMIKYNEIQIIIILFSFHGFSA